MDILPFVRSLEFPPVPLGLQANPPPPSWDQRCNIVWLRSTVDPAELRTLRRGVQRIF